MKPCGFRNTLLQNVIDMHDSLCLPEQYDPSNTKQACFMSLDFYKNTNYIKDSLEQFTNIEFMYVPFFTKIDSEFNKQLLV